MQSAVEITTVDPDAHIKSGSVLHPVRRSIVHDGYSAEIDQSSMMGSTKWQNVLISPRKKRHRMPGHPCRQRVRSIMTKNAGD
jgi:hypothetical protein